MGAWALWARKALGIALPAAAARGFSGDSVSSSALRGSAAAFAIKCGALLLGFLSSVVLTRALGVAGFGTYSLVLGWILLLAVPIQSGLAGVVVRELAGYRATGSFALAKGLMVFATATAVAVAGVGAALLYAYWSDTSGVASAWTSGLVYWALALLPFYCLSALRSAALRGLGRIAEGLFPDEVIRPLAQLSMLLVATWMFGPYLRPEHALQIHGVACIAGFAAGAVMLVRALPPAMRAARARYAVQDWLRPAMTFALVAGFGTIMQSMVVVLLGSRSGSGEVGLFKAAQQLAALAGILVVAVNAACAPHIAALHRSGNRDELARLLRNSARLMLAGTAPLCIAMIAMGAPILGIVFGEDYVRAYPALIVLATGQLLLSMMGLVGLLLNMSGHEKDTLACCVVAIVATLAAVLAAAPHFGSLGAALAVGCGQLVLGALMLWRVRVRIGLSASAFARAPLTQREPS